MEVIIGLIIVLSVVFIVAIIFYPQIKPLYDDVKKIAQEVLNLEMTEEEVEKDLKVKQVFNKIVGDLKGCSESEVVDCQCIFDDRGFSEDYNLKFRNLGDKFVIELYKIKGDGAGMFIKSDEVNGKFALPSKLVDEKIECYVVEELIISPLVSFISKDIDYPKVYKSEKGEICLLTSSFAMDKTFPSYVGGLFPNYKEFKKLFIGKPMCI